MEPTVSKLENVLETWRLASAVGTTNGITISKQLVWTSSKMLADGIGCGELAKRVDEAREGMIQISKSMRSKHTNRPFPRSYIYILFCMKRQEV
jgi:hypothetical protein